MNEEFKALFKGNQRSFGVWNPHTRTMTTELRSYTGGDFNRHLSGEMGLAIVPILDDNTCYYGVIDIDTIDDDKDIDIKAVSDKIRASSLPLIACRSKSGGVHCYMFMEVATSTKTIRAILKAWAIELGFPNAEIFPKQERMQYDPETRALQLGNHINLPYFNAEYTERYAIDNGKICDLQYFVASATTARLSPEAVERLYGTLHPDAPPCLQRLLKYGVHEGSRNTALYNFTIYFKRAFKSNYRELLFDVNNKLFDEPLPHREASSVISSASRRKYFYKCKEEPLASLCDKRACLQRKYGIQPEQDVDDRMPQFAALQKHMTEPVRWILLVDDKTITLSTPQLLDFRAVREAVADTHTKLIPLVPNDHWAKMLEKLMADATVVDAPDDASTAGLMRSKLLSFIKKVNTDVADEVGERQLLLRGVPILQTIDGDRYIVFRGEYFVDFLKRNKAEELRGANLWMALKDMGLLHRKLRVGKSIYPVWCIKHSDITSSEDMGVRDVKPEF